ncbi:GNAT family N-acetyltransferase [Actinoplanes sp. NEAU-A12]|uniref:GNAT family N-acetyltransferase n=1 Tax=Actinoplanes sandaracinus TaxID=3045177 RepID=A0ABT6WRR1_9ACTN|nr:GNAT family N-acetyltransferase [Actinoplanes sandaracinus]MDI6102427.1 GNAT family N-acetyltransferase [Actinoplanes sandaracinus]
MDEGESVRLRPVEAGDVDVFYLQERDPEALRRANFPGRGHDAFVDHWRRRVLGDPTVRARAVIVGEATAGNIVAWWQNGRRHVGYWLGQDFWGRGIGTRALSLFLAESEERTRPLYAEADVRNAASIRMLKRFGFDELEVVKDGPDEFLVLKLD